MTRFFASSSFPPSPSYIRHLAIVLHKHSRASCLPTYVRKGDFPMGPQVKTGTHSVRWGNAICPCCLRGVLSPLLLPPSIHPTLCPSTPRCSLMLIYRAESPRNVLPISLPPSPLHSPPVPSLIHSLLSLHFPPTFPPTLHAFQLTPPICHPSLCS